jgi:N-methylhydantoinase A/oxoprolinase/acetone carboxylase beta subunit
VAVYERAALPPGGRFAGPAVVYEAHGATVVEPGWRGEVDGVGTLVLRRRVGGPSTDES